MNEENLNELKKLKRKRNIWIALSAVLTCALVVVCLFSVYKRYSDPVLWEAPAETDTNQEKIPDESETVPDVITTEPDTSVPTESEPESTEAANEHFSIYSVGDVLTAQNGSGEATCDIRNVEDSTHDIIADFYIEKTELEAHGIDTSKMTESKYLIAESGLFEPGYHITSVTLNKLPDGSVLPAGSYQISMTEHFYHHETKVLASYETSIPMRLEVAE